MPTTFTFVFTQEEATFILNALNYPLQPALALIQKIQKEAQNQLTPPVVPIPVAEQSSDVSADNQ